MRPDQLRAARQAAGLTQQQAATRLRVSQPYLALLERGRRPLTPSLAARLAKLYRLGPTALPLGPAPTHSWDSAALAAALAALGYPGFPPRRGARKRNPAAVLLAAVSAPDLEVRVVEALPWLLAQYSGLDWDWLIREAKLRDAQNRLGFLVTLARRLAERSGHAAAARTLRRAEAVLDRARLARGDTLCQASLSDPERRWLRKTRPSDARHWNLLTDLDARTLPYAA